MRLDREPDGPGYEVGPDGIPLTPYVTELVEKLRRMGWRAPTKYDGSNKQAAVNALAQAGPEGLSYDELSSIVGCTRQQAVNVVHDIRQGGTPTLFRISNGRWRLAAPGETPPERILAPVQRIAEVLRQAGPEGLGFTEIARMVGCTPRQARYAVTDLARRNGSLTNVSRGRWRANT